MSLNATTNFSEILGIPHAFLGEILGIPHAFLGLTKDKSPDELDSQSNIELEKYFNPQSL